MVRIDRLRALSRFYGWWCMAVLSWWSDLSGVIPMTNETFTVNRRESEHSLLRFLEGQTGFSSWKLEAITGL